MQNPTSEYVMHLQVLAHTRNKSVVAYIALTSATWGYRVSKVLIVNNCWNYFRCFYLPRKS